jgi:hypothetical protein
MSDKTLVILKSKDGREFRKVFDTYEEATKWVLENTKKHGIELSLKSARFDIEPTIDIYEETK